MKNLRYAAVVCGLAFLALLGGSVSASAQSECRWFGTQPFCRGQCPSGWKPQMFRGRPFINRCTTGYQISCCRQPTRIPTGFEACYWSGTAPFCNGRCRPGEETRRFSKTGNGKACLSGQKAYCCQNTHPGARR
jgi:chitinase